MFDGSFPKQERAPRVTAQDQLSETRHAVVEAQRREADALIVLKEKEQARDAFFTLALDGERLTEDQKQLLTQLKGDHDLSRLNGVVYTDPQTGAQHTFKEYFIGSEDVLTAATRVIREWEDADATRRMAANIVMGKLRETGEMPVNIKETPRLTLPKLEAKDDLVERRQQWATYQKKTHEHMEHVRQYMETRWSMPNPLDHATKQQPVQQEAPVQAEPQDPARFASPEEATVVMPAIQQMPVIQGEGSKANESLAKRVKGAWQRVLSVFS